MAQDRGQTTRMDWRNSTCSESRIISRYGSIKGKSSISAVQTQSTMNILSCRLLKGLLYSSNPVKTTGLSTCVISQQNCRAVVHILFHCLSDNSPASREETDVYLVAHEPLRSPSPRLPPPSPQDLKCTPHLSAKATAVTSNGASRTSCCSTITMQKLALCP